MHWQTHSRQWGDGCGGRDGFAGGGMRMHARKRGANFEKKKNIIAIRRPIPHLPNTKTWTKICVRHLNSEHYNKLNWLCGCRKTSRLYCTIFFNWKCVGIYWILGHEQSFKSSQSSSAISVTYSNWNFAMTFVTSRIEFHLDQQRKKNMVLGLNITNW